MIIFLRKLSKVDKLTLVIVGCLVAIGTLAVYEATINTKLQGIHINNLILFGVFCVPMLILATIDYNILVGKLSYVWYGLGIMLLLLVMFKGENINGAVRWVSIGSFQLQPSEMMKIATVLLAAHLLQKRGGDQLRFVQDILPLAAVFLLPTVIIMKQPDLGTALVFIAVMISMLWMGNVKAMYMIICLSVIAIAVGTICWLYFVDHDLLAKLVKPHQMSRIQTFLDPTSDPDKSWHVKNAMSAIGTGGLSGSEGFYMDRGFIPYAYSDSIYVVIGEKYGFLGSSILLLLYFMLIYRIVLIANMSMNLAGGYLVIGLVGMIVFQVFVNIGMHIGLVPLTGLSLPFISYGGSSLLTNMLTIGLVMSVHVHRDSIPLNMTGYKQIISR